MRDLVRIADDDLKDLTAGQRLRMFGAISIALTCGIVSLQGMAILFTDAKVILLPGMDQLLGQIAWATALVAMLVAVTILVRGVIKHRLQWAIAASLGIHFLLCLSVSVVEFRGPRPIPALAAELPGATPEEFTLPDYAGEETPNSDSVWKQQSETATPDNNVDIERIEMEIADANKPQTDDPTQAPTVEKVEPMERREQVRLAADAAAEMERQATESDLPTPQKADTPDVTTADSAQPMLDVQMDQAQQSSEAPMAEREQSEIAAADQPLESVKLQAQRTEAAINPEDVQGDMAAKTNTGPEAAMARSSANPNAAAGNAGAESVEVSSATGVGAPAMAESSAATSNRRGSAASVPAGSGADGSSTAASAGQSNGQISGTTVARSANAGNQPTIGNTNGQPGMTGRGEGRKADAVGATANEVGVALAGRNGTKNGEAMIAEPAGTSAGPRLNSVPRRSAGLPGSSGPAATAGAPSGLEAPQPARVAVGSPRAGIGNSQPTLASANVVAEMVKKSVAGRAGSPEARIADSLSMRTSEARREAAKTLGGSPESEEAVERGLLWLALNQYPDGHWSINDFPGEPTADIGQGSFRADSAATGLALLAYLGAGYTHQSGKYEDVVNRGVTWLLKRQKPDGDLFADESEFVWFYSHGMASIALCEAYGLTKDVALKEPAQRALDFIIDAQHPEFGGWRYRPKFESDTSVSGWQLMALKSGEMSGLTVPKDAYVRVGRWLDSVQSKTSAGQFSYHPSQDASPTMTAEGLLMRQYLGSKRDDAQLIAGANFLQTRLPDFGQRDSYYWYYATQVMFHMQGEHWNAWNHSLRDSLVETQTQDGAFSGSWDPVRPTPEKWSSAGGRHYVTCLNLLMLEVYYRHLPLYLELEK